MEDFIMIDFIHYANHLQWHCLYVSLERGYVDGLSSSFASHVLMIMSSYLLSIRVPVVLHVMGILKYSSQLEQKVGCLD
jgi:hypothetical protein